MCIKKKETLNFGLKFWLSEVTLVKTFAPYFTFRNFRTRSGVLYWQRS